MLSSCLIIAKRRPDCQGFLIWIRHFVSENITGTKRENGKAVEDRQNDPTEIRRHLFFSGYLFRRIARKTGERLLLRIAGSEHKIFRSPPLC